MTARENYIPTRHEIHDWQAELSYLLKQSNRSLKQRRRVGALRQLVATHAIA